MSLDLSNLLRDWPYEAGRLNVRMIRGDDGEPKVQVRLDLGVLQMNMEGRPDGHAPFGFPSLLEYHEHRLDELRSGPPGYGLGNPGDTPFGTPDSRSEVPMEDADNPETEIAGDEGSVDNIGKPSLSDDLPDGLSGDASPDDAFKLSPEECKQLRDEAAQYYHRYVALLVLEDYEGVIRDTTRNLRLLDFCRTFAQTEDDGEILEQVRPYITMMRARALANQAIKDNEPSVAVNAIDEGLDALRVHYATDEDGETFEASNEAQMLRSMRETLLPKLPVSQKAELRERLREALARENYELAAILRDELKMLAD